LTLSNSNRWRSAGVPVLLKLGLLGLRPEVQLLAQIGKGTPGQFLSLIDGSFAVLRQAGQGRPVGSRAMTGEAPRRLKRSAQALSKMAMKLRAGARAMDA
jgi:hypothetical protein